MIDSSLEPKSYHVIINELNMEEIKLLLTGNGSGEPFMIDELLIQRQGDPALFKTVSYLNKTWMVYNNYWLSENAFQNQ